MSPVDSAPWAYLQTGHRDCWDEAGRLLPCAGTGQDGAVRAGAPWPEPRFADDPQTPGAVLDRLTGLVWPRDAAAAPWPLPWAEALAFARRMNEAEFLGQRDWRLPNRRELRGLIDHAARRPALPRPSPFRNVFQGWVWTSTSFAGDPSHAWRVHLEGGRMFYGRKTDEALVWLTRGASSTLPRTGQRLCHDVDGRTIPCDGPDGAGQDGQVQAGRPWPEPRFTPWGAPDEDLSLDRLTGLVWSNDFDLTKGPVSWQGALALAVELAKRRGRPFRLPNVNEFESLTDSSRFDPALPTGRPFRGAQEAYWTSTTSGFEADWAYALYLRKGAVGVGHKAGPHFHVAALFGPVDPATGGSAAQGNERKSLTTEPS